MIGRSRGSSTASSASRFAGWSSAMRMQSLCAGEDISGGQRWKAPSHAQHSRRPVEMKMPVRSEARGSPLGVTRVRSATVEERVQRNVAQWRGNEVLHVALFERPYGDARD